MTTKSISLDAIPTDCSPPKFLTVDSIPADARFLRGPLAEALRLCGFPISAKTLATKASRGGGPPYQMFGRHSTYTWGPSVE